MHALPPQGVKDFRRPFKSKSKPPTQVTQASDLRDGAFPADFGPVVVRFSGFPDYWGYSLDVRFKWQSPPDFFLIPHLKSAFIGDLVGYTTQHTKSIEHPSAYHGSFLGIPPAPTRSNGTLLDT